MKRLAIVVSLASLASLSGGSVAAADNRATAYRNCDALNRVYPHGVGRRGAVDRTSGRPVTNFTRNNAVYNANTGRDRDGDKIACEKR